MNFLQRVRTKKFFGKYKANYFARVFAEYYKAGLLMNPEFDFETGRTTLVLAYPKLELEVDEFATWLLKEMAIDVEVVVSSDFSPHVVKDKDRASGRNAKVQSLEACIRYYNWHPTHEPKFVNENELHCTVGIQHNAIVDGSVMVDPFAKFLLKKNNITLDFTVQQTLSLVSI